MKVISGKYKGRKIIGYDMKGTRPTMDRVKESLFAMIQNNLIESTVLDLFAGSGNLGIEALSQGADIAYFVDYSKQATKIIKENIKTIGIENANIINLDYLKALKYFAEISIKFDVIFLDPPYDTNCIEKSIEKITEYNLLNKGGIIICESSNIDKIVYTNSYKSVKEKKYGDKWVVILKQI